VAAIPERVLDDLLLRGPVETIRTRVRQYLDAGVDTAFLLLQSSEPDPAHKREILRSAMRALAPG
jgi:hypothetical protein